MSVWKASINYVKELPSQVSFHVSVPWGVVPYDFSLVVSFALWLWVVRELVFVAALVVEKFIIICKKNLCSLNKRNELASSCPHRNRYLLKNIL